MLLINRKYRNCTNKTSLFTFIVNLHMNLKKNEYFREV